MGCDLLDIAFRIEREMGVKFSLREFSQQALDNQRYDPTVGELFEFIQSNQCATQVGSPSNTTAADWEKLRQIVADVLSVPQESVTRDARLNQDLGCE